ncbi:M56 family metallopeptidase [Streptomyces chiangmaiensis]|uniref:M56 family metallopeptidase n=1 Tax=Streptomyces chiangmaiensis TaxID=766497 RepID=A0ABU7FUK5_9ACTN|nr:M56 family metallopeptidase [Streptomyces chiangmaiensis]MED7827744.1 M56 family metallopeptidase [Streptomyces chiangmaiensis]
MRVALVLLGYAVVLGGVGPVWLARSSWASRAPRLGIWAWQALSATVVLSVALAGLAVAVPTVPVSGNLAEMLQACVMALREQYAAPGGAAVAASGTVLAVALMGRIGWCLGAALLQARRERTRHAEVLAVVGSHRPELGITVLDDARPAAYCLPGHGHRVVLTTAALAALEPAALQAVIAHERAHIRQRHHLVLAVAEGLERAFPRLPLFRMAAEQTPRLVELAADDAATARSGALTLAGALVELAGAGVPAASLAASGGHVAGRVRRLLGPQRPLHRVVSWAGALVVAGALALPLLLAAEPALASTGMNVCPLSDVPMAEGMSAAG